MAAATRDNSTIYIEPKSVSTLCRLYICGLNRNANGGFSRIYKHIKELKLPYKEEMGLAMKRERKKDIDKKIKQFKIKSEISNYLNLHNLYFETDEIEGIPYISMVFKNCDRCPGHITEGSIYFYEECMEVRVYYSEIGTQMCNKSKNLPNLYRLMNYLNAMSWPCVKDGMDGMLYSSEYLVSPRFIITEDGMMDITTIMAIPYSHFIMDTLQIEDYITAALPALLDSLSAPIFLLLEGRINVEDAIDIIETEFQGKN